MLVIYTNPYRNATKRKISLSSKKAQEKQISLFVYT